MACGMKFCRFLLVVINIVFIISGLAIAGLGGFVYWILNSNGAASLNNANGTCEITGLSSQEFASCFSSFCNVFAQNGNGQICDAIRLFPIGFMIIGGFVFLVAILGCCGASKKNRCCLMMYFFILLVIFLAQAAIAVLAFFFTPTVLSYGQTAWDKFPGNNTEHLMILFQCCGFNDISSNESSWCQSVGIPMTMSDGSTKNSCLNLVVALVTSQLAIVGGIGAGVVFLELIGIIGSCVTCKKQKQTNQVKVKPRY